MRPRFPAMRPFSGTARRLIVAFAVLVSTFALSSVVLLWRLRDVQGGLAEIKAREEEVRLTLELASAVRDQYAHQAHTIILGNESHLHYYEEAERRVVALTAEVKARVHAADERAWVEEIERTTADLDRIFRQRIVPAVVRRQEADIQEEHGQAQLLVTRIQGRTDQLVARFETAIAQVQARVREEGDAAVRWTLFFLAGTPLLAAAIGFSIFRSVATPVARLSEGAARLAAGRLDTRIEIDSPDEFGALAAQFNAMTRSLAEHQEKLVQSEKLAGIGRLAAGVAHEINNPLAVIVGYVKLLRRRAEGALAEDLARVEDEAGKAQQIVEGLLDLARAPAAAPEPVDLRALCDEAVARLQETGRLGGARVTVAGAGRVAGQPHRLRQVVLNLVRNGAEAAGPEGRVEVEVAAEPGGARVEVRDDGPGLPEAARGKLFEPFFTTKPTGTGLGLAVSQAIVRAHGGDVTADAAPGGGARFTVRLPATPPGKV